MKIIAIKTNSGVFISDDIDGRNTNDSYSSTKLVYYTFDGVRADATFNKSWLKVAKIPESVKRIIQPQRINTRYEVREQFKHLNLEPVILQMTDEHEAISGMYEYKYEMSEETYEEEPFEIVVIEELDSFEITKKQFDPSYNLLDLLNTHPILLKNKPCKLSCGETYRIIREFVKANINENAVITSDYDFCLTVQKRVRFQNKKEESFHIYGKGRKSNTVIRYDKRYKEFDLYEIFECAPKPYNRYTVVTPFTGENEADLKKNIETYLKDLIGYINEPLQECPHCNGKGFNHDNRNA